MLDCLTTENIFLHHSSPFDIALDKRLYWHSKQAVFGAWPKPNWSSGVRTGSAWSQIIFKMGVSLIAVLFSLPNIYRVNSNDLFSQKTLPFSNFILL